VNFGCTWLVGGLGRGGIAVAARIFRAATGGMAFSLVCFLVLLDFRLLNPKIKGENAAWLEDFMGMPTGAATGFCSSIIILFLVVGEARQP